jgi:hypothetical protein
MTTQQQIIGHPLAKFGHHRLPHWLWRRSRRLYVVCSAVRDIFLIATGRITLHVAWQEGSTTGSMNEYRRIMINGGELVPYVKALREARGALWEMWPSDRIENFPNDPAVKAIDAILESPPWNGAPRNIGFIPGVLHEATQEAQQ